MPSFRWSEASTDLIVRESSDGCRSNVSSSAFMSCRGTHAPHPQRDHLCRRERCVLEGGFGLWELTYPVIGAAIAFRGLRSYRWIGVGWLIHAGWDIAHHVWGNPIWPSMPSSAFGCMIFDSLIATWFLAGAPSFLKRSHAAMRAAGA
jgi:hypothetical protein